MALVVLGLTVYAIVDSSGTVAETPGRVVSVGFVEGMSTTTQIVIDAEHGISVPMTSTLPGSWRVVIDSPVLGRREVYASEANLRPGQDVYVEYRVGRLSRGIEIREVRLHRRPILVE
jgi:hypothetical protein